MRTQKILVVADRTAEAPELVTALRRQAEESPSRFTLLVTADADGLAFEETTEAAWCRALTRAELAAARIREAGLELEEAIVGDPDPALAVGDAGHAREFDRVVFFRRERERAARVPVAA
jgi:histidinol dehydrogenase